jgi:hypothetical protein
MAVELYKEKEFYKRLINSLTANIFREKGSLSIELLAYTPIITKNS